MSSVQPPPLRVAIVSKTDGGDGGSSRVAEQCVTWLREAGLQTTHFVGYSSKSERESLELYWPNTTIGRRFYRLQKIAGFLDIVPLELPRLWSAVVGNFDVVHFHNLSAAISPLSVRALAARIPVVWTFHDFSPFTAGCLYPMGCTKYETSCSGCPSNWWPLDSRVKFTGLMHGLKDLVHAHPNVTCTAPTDWLADMAVSARAITKRPRVISNRIDLELFKSTEKTAARETLGLPATGPFLLMSANSVGDPRKGTREGIAALRALRGIRPTILLMGNPDAEVDSLLSEYRVHSFGYVRDPARQALIYSAADAFVFPTLAEVQGLAVLESIACGTPVIGFASGGVPSMIEQHKTGILVPTGDVGALTSALEEFIADSVTDWRSHCLSAARQFDKSIFVREHLALYADAISNFVRLR